MRQKYLMIRDDSEKILKIREYAIVDKDLKNVSTANLREEHFFLLYEETYESAIIESVIASKENLVQTLRTANFFPAAIYAAELAGAVMDLYGEKAGGQSELFFDDKLPRA